jgi:hypothetical protein
LNEKVLLNVEKGIIYKLRLLNPNEVELTCSSPSNPSGYGIENILIADSDIYWASTVTQNSFFTIHFQTSQVFVDSYIIYSWTSCFPTGWKLEGSNDNFHWTFIDKKSNERCFTSQNTKQTFTYSSSDFFSYFRITSTQPCYN